MKLLVVFGGLLFVALSIYAANVTAQRAENAIPERHAEVMRVGLSGYSPVSYHRAGRGVRGSWDYMKTYKDITYFFADEAEVESFEKEPEKFLPQYGGYCTRALAGGRAHRPNPTCYRIIKEKLYLFGSEEALAEFEAEGEDTQIEEANKNYREIVMGGRGG